MAGYQVNRQLLDMRTAEAIVAVRQAFRKVETLSAFLTQVPSNAAGGDPLTDPEGPFGYTADEAYLIRVVIENLDNLPVDNILAMGRQLTGLE